MQNKASRRGSLQANGGTQTRVSECFEPVTVARRFTKDVMPAPPTKSPRQHKDAPDSLRTRTLRSENVPKPAPKLLARTASRASTLRYTEVDLLYRAGCATGELALRAWSSYARLRLCMIAYTNIYLYPSDYSKKPGCTSTPP